MHTTYRAELAKLTLARDQKAKPLRDDYAKKLDELVTSLTKAGKLQEAMTVKKFRESLPVFSAGTSNNPPAGTTPHNPEPPAATKGAAPWITPQVPQPNSSGWITLFDGQRLAGCNPSAEDVTSGKVGLKDGVLRLDSKGIHFDVVYRNAVLRVQTQKVSGQNVGLYLRRHVAWFNGGRNFGIGKTSPSYSDIKSGLSSKACDDFFDMEFTVVGSKLTLKANGRTTVAIEDQDKDIKKGASVIALKGVSLFRRIEIKILDD